MSAGCICQVILNSAIDVIVLRATGGAWNEKGRFEEGEREKITIKASVQPARGRELLRLEEARRNREAIKLYTPAELRTVETSELKQPDVIEWQGERFEVELVDDWDLYGGYYKAVALKMEQRTDAS